MAIGVTSSLRFESGRNLAEIVFGYRLEVYLNKQYCMTNRASGIFFKVWETSRMSCAGVICLAPLNTSHYKCVVLFIDKSRYLLVFLMLSVFLFLSCRQQRSGYRGLLLFFLVCEHCACFCQCNPLIFMYSIILEKVY